MSQQPSEMNHFEEQESVEIPNSNGARKSKLATNGDTIRFAYENLETTWDAVENGHKISKNGRCFGWRSSKSSYSWITYDEFIKRAENFGSGLVKIGLKPGQSSNVGIYAQNCVEWVVAQFGIWSQSAILIPLYDTLGPDASIFMIHQAEIEVAICDQEQKVRNLIDRRDELPSLKYIVTIHVGSEELMNFAKEKGIQIYSFNEIEVIGEKFPAALLPPQTSDTAIICYTSGTTGDPKGVILTHKNLMSACTNVHLMMGNTAQTKDDSVISYLPLAHIFGQLVQLLFLMVGGSIGFFSGDINQLVDDMRVLQPTFFPAVPRLLNKLYDKAQALVRSKLKFDLSGDHSTKETELKSVCKPFIDSLGGRIRFIFSGAAPIYKNVLEFYTKIVGCTVMEVYGQTECGGPCSFVLLDSYYTGNVGAPVPCCIVKLADVPEMGYFSKDSKGEVCIKGPAVFKGYLKNPMKTAEALDDDGWLHTGDIGMWLPVKDIHLHPGVLTFEDGFLTPTSKLKRDVCKKHFTKEIAALCNNIQ
ncbi:Long-chain-fatty-acid--CoA ligase 5 like protein [Argiope bruennichi]|uniref:long-chain-fatty-acid--CoA ligase n=1 Tax=Argiope bruennichi TaxID=94029 RepID=A0A8T0EXD4_ARGBR|nr:Long-chain-fatty-acid--CoA ligase 5 like protein [Argiope bruennichi]